MSRVNSRLAAGTLQEEIRTIYNAAFNEAVFKLESENPLVSTFPADGQNFARMHVRPAGNSNFALGSNGDKLRGQGVVIVQVFIRRSGGTFTAHDVADALDQISNTEISPATYNVSINSSLRVHVRTVGPAMYSGSKEGFEQWNVEIPYFWDSSDAKAFVNSVNP